MKTYGFLGILDDTILNNWSSSLQPINIFTNSKHRTLPDSLLKKGLLGFLAL